MKANNRIHLCLAELFKYDSHEKCQRILSRTVNTFLYKIEDIGYEILFFMNNFFKSMLNFYFTILRKGTICNCFL